MIKRVTHHASRITPHKPNPQKPNNQSIFSRIFSTLGTTAVINPVLNGTGQEGAVTDLLRRVDRYFGGES